jgi:glycogen(starch) synthase
MKVLMLGWEYPPHISGGLGTACEGLSKALARQGVGIDFVIPRLHGGENASHMAIHDTTSVTTSSHLDIPAGVTFHAIPAHLQPYWRPETYQAKAVTHENKAPINNGRISLLNPSLPASSQGEHYGNNIFEEVARFTHKVVQKMKLTDADVIHAHDWMTFPAGVALSEITGKPLIVHVHSLESDRSGESVNTQIHEIERFGITKAHQIIAVSHYTAEEIAKRHGVAKSKISVIHNGVYPKQAVEKSAEDSKEQNKNVLFLGRVTFQKGPDYFVEAAAKVIPHAPNTTFIMAGSGDMLNGMIERVVELGIEDNFRFPGFLRGKEVDQMYSLADLYVMPSVSEPFGIAPLEAINQNTPVLLSKQAGVGEVLNHALKFDFWDVDRLAELIIAALRHEELRNDLLTMSKEEVKRIRWDSAASKTATVYQQIVS